MSQTDRIRAFRVVIEDEWLDIENFYTIKADSEEEAEQKFKDNHARGDGTQEVVSVEEAYSLNADTMRRLIGTENLENFDL